MKLLTSKNGESTSTKSPNAVPRAKSDLILRTELREDGLYSSFNFAGAWKMLDLEKNGIALGLNNDEKPCVFLFLEDHPSVLVFGASKGKKKTKIAKIDTFLHTLFNAGLVKSVRTGTNPSDNSPIYMDGFNEKTSFNQYLSLNKIENDEDSPEGLIGTYEVVANSEIPAGLVPIKEVSPEVVASIQATRAANKAKKEAAKA